MTVVVGATLVIEFPAYLQASVHVADARAADASPGHREPKAPLGLHPVHMQASTEALPEFLVAQEGPESDPRLSHLGSRGLGA